MQNANDDDMMCSLQCFDAVGWATGRLPPPPAKKLEFGVGLLVVTI